MNKSFAKSLLYFFVSFLCSCLTLIPFRAQAAEPRIAASAAVLLDLDSGAVLWEKNSREPLPPASTTKILTAILALDVAPEDSRYLVTPQAAAVGEASIDLVAGQNFTVGELLRGALIASGNDAAYALGEAAAGSEQLFIPLAERKRDGFGSDEHRFL